MAELNKEIYQDIWVGGKVVQKGVRDCESRFNAIADLLKFKRPFSILDLGANFGYYSFRLLEKFSGYDPVAVMLESPRGAILADICSRNEHLKKLIVLDKRIGSADILMLSACEHFDLVLCLNFLHHQQSGWEAAINAVLKVGKYVVIETPHPSDPKACGQQFLSHIKNMLESKGCRQIGGFSRHTGSVPSLLYWYENPLPRLERSWFRVPDEANQKNFRGGMDVFVDWDSIHAFHYRKKQRTDWIPGLNFRTFQCLNGIYPQREGLLETVRARDLVGADKHHGDLQIWNVIMNGERLYLIDGKPWMKRGNEPAFLKMESELKSTWSLK